MDYAVTIPKAKRKRRKPPGPDFWWALMMVILSLAQIVGIIWAILQKPTPPEWFIGSCIPIGFVWVVLLHFDFWPAFMHELEKWRNDD